MLSETELSDWFQRLGVSERAKAVIRVWPGNWICLNLRGSALQTRTGDNEPTRCPESSIHSGSCWSPSPAG